MIKKIIILLAFIITVLSVCYYLEFEDYYRIGEKDYFNIKVGQELQIKLYENGSTGYTNCWLNEKNNTMLIKVKEEYSQGLYARLKYDGAGGINKISFKGIKVGVDTIKIAHCSSFDGKKYEEYNEKNTESDYEFIVNITR